MMRSVEILVERLVAICFLVTGVSHVAQPRTWARFFIMLHGKGESGSLLNGLIHFPMGAFIVSFHNVWHGLPLVVTLLGWSLVIKSLIYLAWPQHGMRMLSRISEERSWMFAAAGVLAIALSGLTLYISLRT